ncbi:MAG: hypothetical protein JRD43_06030 [Deltaproteobacteria bacterium]|nr:hypothetical protein [Deltaproteobacteria bacterium]
MIKHIKYIFVIVVLMVIMPALCLAEAGREETAAIEKVGGTIPVIQKVYVSGEGNPDLFSSIGIENFLRGFKETNTGRVVLTVLANAPWKVSARTEFKPVGGYIKPASDLLVKIKDKTVVEKGAGTGGNFNERYL